MSSREIGWLAATVLVLGGTDQLLAQEPSRGLRIVVSPADASADERGPAFRITLTNHGPSPLLLNAGFMLGNARQSWAGIQCSLQSGQARPRPLDLHWRLGPVGGRVYFLGVPLRPGDAHVVNVRPDDYALPAPLEPGRYRLQCAYTGVKAAPDDAAAWPICRDCAATSRPVTIAVSGRAR